MSFVREYLAEQASRSDIDALKGAVILEFGTGWCGYCRAAQGPLEEAITQFPAAQHMKVEDGSGRPLGRSFRVKLWPTIIFLKDGVECERLVRPTGTAEIVKACESIS